MRSSLPRNALSGPICSRWAGQRTFLERAVENESTTASFCSPLRKRRFSLPFLSGSSPRFSTDRPFPLWSFCFCFFVPPKRDENFHICFCFIPRPVLKERVAFHV